MSKISIFSKLKPETRMYMYLFAFLHVADQRKSTDHLPFVDIVSIIDTFNLLLTLMETPMSTLMLTYNTGAVQYFLECYRYATKFDFP